MVITLLIVKRAPKSLSDAREIVLAATGDVVIPVSDATAVLLMRDPALLQFPMWGIEEAYYFA